VLKEIKMRDLVLRNLTSLDKKRKVISSSEINTSNGICTKIRRNFICSLKSIREPQENITTAPKISIYKNHDTLLHTSKFLYKIKGNIYVVNQEQIYIVSYIHSFKLELAPES